VLHRKKPRTTKQSRTFLIEEVIISKGGYKLETILFYPEICTEIEAKTSRTTELIEINKEDISKISVSRYRRYFVSQNKILQLSDLKLSNNPLILAAEAPRLEMVLCYELQTQLIWTL
jgi:TrmH family RNA methyltransferase